MPAGFFNNGSNTNTLVGADNVDFSGSATPTPQVTSNGQLLIGASSSPNIRVSTLTAGTGMTITNGPGTIILSTTAAQTDLHTAKWIVNSTANAGGNSSTIQNAINQAVSGDTIFIMPGNTGTYTENITLKAGVNLTAFTCDAFTPNVTIIGTCTLTTAGTVTISGIRLQTNSAALLAVTGSAASIVNLIECYLNCTNNTGITYSSSSSSSAINITNCKSDLGTTGIGLFSHSSAGTLTLSGLFGTNTGASTTTSTCSAGILTIQNCLINFPIAVSGTGITAQDRSSFDSSSTNTTCLALTSGGSTNSSGAHWCRYYSGSASAISAGSNTVFTADYVEISSSNTNAITGTGTIIYGPINFIGNSSIINTTTQTSNITRYGVLASALQPCFFGYLASTVTNKTGNGTSYTLGTDALTRTINQSSSFGTNGVFTAPIAGIYRFTAGVLVTNCTVASNLNLNINTSGSGISILSQNARPAGSSNFGAQCSGLISLAASDTVSAVVTVTGEAGATNSIFGSAVPATYFCGELVS